MAHKTHWALMTYIYHIRSLAHALQLQATYLTLGLIVAIASNIPNFGKLIALAKGLPHTLTHTKGNVMKLTQISYTWDNGQTGNTTTAHVRRTATGWELLRWSDGATLASGPTFGGMVAAARLLCGPLDDCDGSTGALDAPA